MQQKLKKLCEHQYMMCNIIDIYILYEKNIYLINLGFRSC